MSGKHTPGPWRNQGWVSTWAYIPVYDASHNLVASMYPDSGHNYTREEVEANAHLIAAAPGLLEVVRDIVSDCEGVINPGLYALAVEAIAKAEGGAS